VLSAFWAGAVGVGGSGEAGTADRSVGPADPDPGDVLLASVAKMAAGRARAAALVLKWEAIECGRAR